MTSPLSKLVNLSALLALLAVAGAPMGAYGQGSVEYSEQAERFFQDGLKRFKSEDYAAAHRIFERVYSASAPNQRTTASQVMDAKALSRMGKTGESSGVLDAFLKRFPQSLYVADAKYTLGLNAIHDRDFETALAYLLEVIDESADPSLTGEAESIVRTLIEDVLSPATVSESIQFFGGRASGDFVNYVYAEHAYALNDLDSARDRLHRIISDRPGGRYEGRARALLRQIEGGGNVKVGVLLPLFSKVKDQKLQQLGLEFLAGARLAADEQNTRPRTYTKVSLEIRDTERDPILAARLIQELVNDPDIVAVVGPIFSAEVFATAGVANTKGVPLISPTANANGIASVGRYVFQANPDYLRRGQAMAQYAVGKRGYQTVAVLAPIEAVGKNMAESFIEEAQRLGATVIATEWYGRGSTDLYPQFRSIREKGLMKSAQPILSFKGKLTDDFVEKLVGAGASLRLVDSLLEKGSTIGVDTVLGPRGRFLADSLELPVTYPDLKLDSLHIPVTSIDAIYIPIAGADEIGIVSSQLVYYNIQAQILGTGDWYDAGELEANKRYVGGVIFTSDTYADPDDSTEQRFLALALDRMNVRATNNTMFVYDTMNLLFSVINDGAITREQITNNLGEVRKFKGLHSLISFNERVNTELHILQYREGKVRKIEDITVDEPVSPVSPE